MTTYEQRRKLEQLSPEKLAVWQLDRLNQMLSAILPSNRFYAKKLEGQTLPLTTLSQLTTIPFTSKSELIGEGDDLLAANVTFSLDQYVHYHRTSGTHGHPLPIMDTASDWEWWVDTWQYVLDAADVIKSDRVFMAFSFGPFIGFWSAYDAMVARGALVIPGGGLSTKSRLELIRSSRATVVCCTPSYALHLAEIATQDGIDLPSLGVRKLIVAGEPGGSVPAIRDRMEAAWGSTVIDHAGATEVGPWGYADTERTGIHIVESEFIAEFLPLSDDGPAKEGGLCELVLTSLGRHGSPVIRYRTGDVVRPNWSHGLVNRFVLLPEGVIGRVDDMLIIRGVNVFPTAIEAILRSFPEVVEFRATARKDGEMDSLSIEVEDELNEPLRICRELELRMGLRIEVENVPAGSLPRFEGKARRFIDTR